MPELSVRLIILALVCIFTWVLIRVGQRFVEIRRQRAFTAEPSIQLASNLDTLGESAKKTAHIHILAFSSADCRQCHQLQAPALRRVIEECGDTVSLTQIDATTSPELTQRYQVLTVPTTVLLDVSGKVHAVNYGFTNLQRLLTQINTILAET